MVQSDDIGWGKYNKYEGPYYRGKSDFSLGENPDEAQKILAVITATEGGRYDAYNGYDRCICTSGLIQWCEARQFSVSNMLAAVAAVDRDLIKSVDDLCTEKGVHFSAGKEGRFHFLDGRGEVTTLKDQQQLFLLNSSGRIGCWDEESKEHAKQWAAAISTVWESEEAQAIQREFTRKKLYGFAMPSARFVIDSAPNTPVGNAFKAAYLSFAANNPTWASKHLRVALQKGFSSWSADWLIGVLKELTFGPKVTIYPHRYNKIRPVLEKLYDVQLPDFVDELRAWKSERPHSVFYDVKQLQEALILLGFDLGPWGADGVYGSKTKEAILDFEERYFGEPSEVMVPPIHADGMMDDYTAKKLEWVLNSRGLSPS